MSYKSANIFFAGHSGTGKTTIASSLDTKFKSAGIKAIDFTGISSTYYSPEDPEVVMGTELLCIHESTDIIFKLANR